MPLLEKLSNGRKTALTAFAFQGRPLLKTPVPLCGAACSRRYCKVPEPLEPTKRLYFSNSTSLCQEIFCACTTVAPSCCFFDDYPHIQVIESNDTAACAKKIKEEPYDGHWKIWFDFLENYSKNNTISDLQPFIPDYSIYHKDKNFELSNSIMELSEEILFY